MSTPPPAPSSAAGRPSWSVVLRLKAIQAYDRLRLRRLKARHPGLEISEFASSNLASARYDLAPGSRLRIAAGVTTDRRPGALHFSLEPGAEIDVGEHTWLRTDIGDVHLIAFAGGHMKIERDAFLNGCHLSCKSRLTVGRRAFIGPGSRVFDSDQHDLDADRPETSEPVKIGDYSWVASEVTILRGVTIGEHCVIGTHSLVTRSVPAHSLAFGQPARRRAEIGDRSSCR